MHPVIPGIDSLIAQAEKYKSLRLGLITNNAACTHSGESSRTALLKSELQIVKLFSPEHGLSAAGIDGAFQKNFTDPVTQLPVISLYGEKLKPDAAAINDIDAFLFDVPDVGCRYYTYLWTMTLAMEAAATHHKKFLLLDRPNPAGGNLQMTEGHMLDETNCSSFIGRWNIPLRHCCTLGELAIFFSKTKIPNTDLEIIRLKNWNRNEKPLLKNEKFIPPSPAIRDMETVVLYSGMGLLEGVNLSEGWGTPTPFKITGAPWIDEKLLAQEFDALKLPGIKANPVCFIPNEGMYRDTNCKGLKFSITNTETFRPVHTALQLIRLIQKLFPQHCRPRKYPTVANPSGENHLDRLTGVLHSFEKSATGEIEKEKFWTPDSWEAVIRNSLLY